MSWMAWQSQRNRYERRNVFRCRLLRACDQFLEAMFGSALPEYAARTTSILVILSCGGLYTNDESFEAVSDFAQL